MCEHGEGHVISHCSMCFPYTCASMVVRTFIHSYSRLSLVSRSLSQILTDVQALIACSINACVDARTASDKALYIS